MTRGRFISLEGGEGVGKSTQLAALAEALKARGVDLVVTREPGADVEADGQLIGRTPVEIGVNPGALRILVPDTPV